MKCTKLSDVTVRDKWTTPPGSSLAWSVCVRRTVHSHAASQLWRSKTQAIACVFLLSVITLLYQVHVLLQSTNSSALTRMRKTSGDGAMGYDVIPMRHLESRSEKEVDASRRAYENSGESNYAKNATRVSPAQCNVTFRYQECFFAVASTITEKVVTEPSGRLARYLYRYRQGSLSLEGRRVARWRAADDIFLFHVDRNCHVIGSLQLKVLQSELEAKDSFQRFVKGLPRGAVLIGVVYGENKLLQKTFYKMGISNSALASAKGRSAVLAVMFRKGYPGHAQYASTPKGRNQTHLKSAFYSGHDFACNLSDTAYTTILQQQFYWNRITEDGGYRSNGGLWSHGGHWRPQGCVPRWRLALIVPFRSREQHLLTFMENIFRFLQQQQIEFTLFVVEQAAPEIFNRAALMNIGYSESSKLGDFDCFVFHDVDQVPEDLANYYACGEMPRHLVVTRSVTDYELRYEAFFGGGMAMTSQQIERINGFPNRIFGWGGEDDEIWSRIESTGMTIARYPREIGRYASLEHGTDRGNPHLIRRRKAIRAMAARFMAVDGLNSMNYTLLVVERRALYTHIFVKIPGPTETELIPKIYPQEAELERESSAKSKQSNTSRHDALLVENQGLEEKKPGLNEQEKLITNLDAKGEYRVASFNNSWQVVVKQSGNSTINVKSHSMKPRLNFSRATGGQEVKL